MRKINPKINPIGGVSLSVLFLLVAVMLLPYSQPDANAESATARLATEFNATVNPSISIAAPSSFDIDLTLDATQIFAQSTGKVAVYSNNTSGYRLLIQSQNTTSLTSRDNSSEKVITTINNDMTLANFTANTWGYYLGMSEPNAATVYHALSTSTTEAVNSDKLASLTEKTDYQLAFGVSIDNSLPAGTYSNEIILSAVANPLEVHSLMDLTFMQDMTAAVCEATASAYNPETGTSDPSSEYFLKPITKQLIDTRDGNKYWVAKLADGNCWMTQNLALNLGEAPTNLDEIIGQTSKFVRILRPEDSDMKVEWPLATESFDDAIGSNGKMRSTEVTVPATLENPPYFDTRSWNLGKWIFPVPTSGLTCSSDTSMEVCEARGLAVNVSDSSKFSADLTATLGDWMIRDEAGAEQKLTNTTITLNCTEWNENICVAGAYDAHYLFGNYYQFNTAVAGSEDKNGRNGKAPASICPKGWMMPFSGPGSYDESSGMAYLLRQYGLATAENKGKATTTIGGVATNIALAPIYMNTGTGSIVLNQENPLYFVGSGRFQTGTEWSFNNGDNSKPGTTLLIVNYPNYINPTHGPNAPTAGQSVRCLNSPEM